MKIDQKTLRGTFILGVVLNIVFLFLIPLYGLQVARQEAPTAERDVWKETKLYEDCSRENREQSFGGVPSFGDAYLPNCTVIPGIFKKYSGLVVLLTRGLPLKSFEVGAHSETIDVVSVPFLVTNILFWFVVSFSITTTPKLLKKMAEKTEIVSNTP